MNIKNLLRSWDIIIPSDVGIAEYLCENRIHSCFFIDKLPLTVSKQNYKKFDQVDIFFQEVLEGKVAKDEFLQIEKKYRNVMMKLWLYNTLYIELNVDTVNKGILNDVIEEEQKKYLTVITNYNKELQAIEVLEKEELEFWVQVGIRDAAFPIYYFEDYELLLVPTWSCFFAYLHDKTKHQIVKDIVTSEGLFLRQALSST